MSRPCTQPGRHVVTPPLPPSAAEGALLDQLIAALPAPSQPLTEVHTGGSFVAARTATGVALSSTLGARPGPGDMEQVDTLIGQPIAQVARLLHGPSGFLRAVGLAALDAGFPLPAAAIDGNAADLLADWSTGRHLVIVGDFPFWVRLAEDTRALDLIELSDTPDRLPPERWDEALGHCEVLALTSTTLLTASLSRFLRAAPQARTVILGPSTPWSEVLFDWGVDVIGGSALRDAEAVIEGVRQGEHFHALKGRGALPLLWSRRGHAPSRTISRAPRAG